MNQINVPEHLKNIGEKIQKGWKAAADVNKIKIEVTGIYPLSHFEFKYSNNLALRTLFTQMMLGKGFLAANLFYASYAHKAEHVEKYLQAVNEAFKFISGAIEKGNPEKYLKGPVCHSGFTRLD